MTTNCNTFLTHITDTQSGKTISVDKIISALEGQNFSSGFINYNDMSTQGSPLVIPSNVWTDIPNDGLGTFSNNEHKPYSVTELMDTSTGYLDLSELELGSSVFVRNDFSITPSLNNEVLEFRYTLGTGLGSYTLESMLGRLDSGAGVPYRFSLRTDYIYIVDDNTRSNPIKLQVRLSGPATLVNQGTVIQAQEKL